MKIKTSELTGATLDWAVAKAEGSLDETFKVGDALTNKVVLEHGTTCFDMRSGRVFAPSTDWSQGGPIIEREEICILDKLDLTTWVAQLARARTRDGADGFHRYYRQTGPTPLIAAMRCFMTSKLGDEVEVPEELT